MIDTSDFQFSPHHSALRCLFLVALHHGLQLPPEALAGTDQGDTFGSILRVMREVGLKGKVIRNRNWNQLASLGSAYPAICVHNDGTWVIVINVVSGQDGQVAAVLDPRRQESGIVLVPSDRFVEEWSGTMLLCKRKFRLTDDTQPFGLRWFLPEIMRQGRYFRDVALAAIVSNIIGFSTPLLLQILIDKVLGHHSYQTLVVVVLVFMVFTLFDGLFNYVRQYLMVFTTNKINAALASRTFQHLLSLPLPFFESTPAGVLSRNLQQTETVRQFLTGRLFQTLLDAAALPLLLVLCTLYSGKLTLVVLGFSLAIASVMGLMIPAFRHHLEQLYQAEGARQAHLVETVHGIRTFKSLALEPSRISGWEDKVATVARRHATVGKMSALAGVLTQMLEKTMQIAVLGVGALDVFDGTLSVGGLVAFNMVAGRVTGPLVQIVGLINEYQQTALAVKMLGQVMNHAPERGTNHAGLRPPITGLVEFDQVTFRYPGAASPTIDKISFKVDEGQMIGVVGRSGSGKTTVTRLIQAIHTAQEGMIRLNGTDIRHIDLPHLRRSVGVVLQDNFLYRGTIRENIAAAKPDAVLAEIVEAARLAGADEFIDRLPMSYETMVEENATNFSGGQRQRIAIARTLLLRPKLLIFDEATSALDPDSESIIQKNLNEIARGRTMIIVSHRLSSLAGADSILVIERGQVLDFAPHETLLERCDVYRHLWQQQTQHIK